MTSTASPTAAAPTMTKIQALIALIASDALIDFGTAVGAFLAQTVAANGDPLKEGAALVQLQGAIIGAAPGALGGLEGQLATVVAAKVQAKVSAAPAQQAAALAAL